MNKTNKYYNLKLTKSKHYHGRYMLKHPAADEYDFIVENIPIAIRWSTVIEKVNLSKKIKNKNQINYEEL